MLSMILRTLRYHNFLMTLLVVVLSLQCSITSEAKTNPDIYPRETSHTLFVRETKLNDHEADGVSEHDLSRTPRPNKVGENEQNVLKPNVTAVPHLKTDSQSEMGQTILNSSVSRNETEFVKKFGPYKLNPGALLRAFYVFGGLSAVVLMYILVRTIRLRRKKTTIRRYGILTNREDVEMTPLGAEDDEDTTIFELNNH